MTQEEKLFRALYSASTEDEVDRVIEQHPEIFERVTWHPYGDNESNFGVVENQQASPVPALVEKIINSIDAILMRRCLEENVDPESECAPRSVDHAVERFFPDAANWDLPRTRRRQAEHIQILADGPKRDTSLIVYDNGEGQLPTEFENTFLSLLRGNKNQIHFVQGKYNMGGSGALIFCGKKRYQLIGSRRFDKSAPFGYTLMRRHPLTPAERHSRKNTWYEYLKIEDKIPFFDIESMNLGLRNRQFQTGTIIKLYSYRLPRISTLGRDLSRALNEYLFEPALPLYIVDTKDRFPKDHGLQTHIFGLKRRLDKVNNTYVEDSFSVEASNQSIGNVKITCYVFKTRIKGNNAKESKNSIRTEFFKNNMSVLFSVNGQVHGHYTSEFITKSLKFPLLKDYLLIHVDCTHLTLEFKNELFMASRDRLKHGEESKRLRQFVAKTLKSSKLKDIHRARRQVISVDGDDIQDMLSNLSKDLPLKDDLLALLNRTVKIDRTEKQSTPKKRSSSNGRAQDPPFQPKRFPTYLQIETKSKAKDGLPMIRMPLNGDRTVRFASDVENHYFDRVEEPGEFHMALLGLTPNQSTGGDKVGMPDRIEDLFDVAQSSPDKGTIRVNLTPKNDLAVGDTVKMKAVLSGPGTDFESLFWIKLTSPVKKSKKHKPKQTPSDYKIGLPAYKLVSEHKREGHLEWDVLKGVGISIDKSTVMEPYIEGDKLKEIYINMDSRVLMNYKKKLPASVSPDVADRQYISAVYFHTLFLYTTTHSLGYRLQRETNNLADGEVSIAKYLRDIFEHSYSDFLLRFMATDLLVALAD